MDARLISTDRSSHGAEAHVNDAVARFEIAAPGELCEPEFAARFNAAWLAYCSHAPLEQALAAIGVYEIFDNPDYRMLMSVVHSAGVSGKTLRFFAVHAGARHFALFETLVARMLANGQAHAIADASSFVLRTQEAMWSDLLTFLEAKSSALSR